MAIADDLKKTLTDPTPLYFAAGTADLAVQQAKKVPGLIEQLRAEAPARIEAVKNTDPKVVQEKAKEAAKEAQEAVTAKVAEVFGAIDPKKLGETAQDWRCAASASPPSTRSAPRRPTTRSPSTASRPSAPGGARSPTRSSRSPWPSSPRPRPSSTAAEASTGEEKPAAKRTAARKATAKKATVTAGDES